MIAACGGDTDKTGDRKVPGESGSQAPQATQPVEEAVQDLEKLVAAKTCEERLQYLRSYGPDGQPGVSDEDCEIAGTVVKDLAEVVPLENARSKEFGIGAVTDFGTDAGSETITWTLDTNGRYRFLGRFPTTEPELDTKPQDSDAFDEGVAEQWTTAIAERDCATVYRLFVSDSPKVQGRSQEDFCPLLEAAYATPTTFFAQIEGGPGARPEFFGGTENVGFFGLRPTDDSYYVIVTAAAATDLPSAGHAKYGIFDYSVVQRPAG